MFDGNEVTKKTKKNLLKQQYGNFKAEVSETLEQTFNRLQVIVGQLQSDLDTISLDDLYNHLKFYESEVQKKSEPISQNMAFISSAKHNSGNEDGNTSCVPTASTNVPTASVATISQDTTYAYIASQSSGLPEDRTEEGETPTDKGPCMVADEKDPTEFALMANTSTESKKLEILKKEKEGVDEKLAGFLTASKDLDNLVESQRADKNKDGLGYSDVPPPPAQIYSSPKKDLSWTGLLEFADDTVTDYSRPSPTMESTSGDDQNRNPSVSEAEASPSAITPKPFIKFVKSSDSPTKSKIDKDEKAKKSPVKYAKQYRKTIKKPNVRGNQKNWNNLKSYQLGPDFVMKKKACFNYGDFNHLACDCRKRVKREHQDIRMILIRVSHPDLVTTDSTDLHKDQ
nr:hypothetical protein [Tanacetum cinerariifolium]